MTPRGVVRADHPDLRLLTALTSSVNQIPRHTRVLLLLDPSYVMAEVGFDRLPSVRQRRGSQTASRDNLPSGPRAPLIYRQRTCYRDPAVSGSHLDLGRLESPRLDLAAIFPADLQKEKLAHVLSTLRTIYVPFRSVLRELTCTIGVRLEHKTSHQRPIVGQYQYARLAGAGNSVGRGRSGPPSARSNQSGNGRRNLAEPPRMSGLCSGTLTYIER